MYLPRLFIFGLFRSKPVSKYYVLSKHKFTRPCLSSGYLYVVDSGLMYYSQVTIKRASSLNYFEEIFLHARPYYVPY